MKASISLFLTSLVAFSWAAPADEKPNVVIEPFFANWCAKQFPTQLNEFNSYSMVRMMAHDNHEKIEPWIGRWCFEQFPEELSGLNEDSEINDLYTSHKQLEPFLEVWGANSLELTDLVDIEPYIGEWCAEQWPSQLAHLKPTLYKDVQNQHVKFEPVLAKWCFAQFKDELQGLDMPSTVEELKTKHELVENELILWTLTTNSALGNAQSTTVTSSGSAGGNTASTLAIAILSVLLACALAALFVVTRRGRAYAEQANTTQGVDMVVPPPVEMS